MALLATAAMADVWPERPVKLYALYDWFSALISLIINATLDATNV